ncbi:MAG: TetR/AcrR family transcriptional regulator [Bacteroidales bacterium]|nr:TetR/AcrR family transcriptional regulator [Bacteroidales bacterium]
MNEKIVEISTKLFLDRGIKAVSMDDVAQALGISKRTLYETFSSKDELLVHCLEHMNKQAQESHKELESDNKDVIEILTGHLFLTIMQLKQVSIAFLQDLSRVCKPGASNKYIEEKERHKAGFANLISRGQKEGFIKTDIKPELIIDVFTEQGQAIKEIYATGKYTMEEIFMNIFVNYLRGACTRKGIERIDELIEQFKNK